MINSDVLFQRLKKIRFGVEEEFLHSYVDGLMPLIEEIEELKKSRNAVILAHSYVSPVILFSVADFVGDSYGLSKDALNVSAQTIVFAAVRFMGETAKLLNPDKDVLIPGDDPACTLADSINGAEVRKLREENPDYTFVCYINTTADVKAECDVCVTSSNIYDIVERIPNDKIFFLPDRLMGKNLIEEMAARGVKKDVLLTDGSCYVHEKFDPQQIIQIREAHSNLYIMAHPECSPEVIKEADFVGSTSQMFNTVKKMSPDRSYLMLTECGLISRIEAEIPDRNFVGSCQLCQYMKSNHLAGIHRVLKNPQEDDYVRIEEKIIDRARACVDAMFQYGV